MLFVCLFPGVMRSCNKNPGGKNSIKQKKKKPGEENKEKLYSLSQDTWFLNQKFQLSSNAFYLVFKSMPSVINQGNFISS